MKKNILIGSFVAIGTVVFIIFAVFWNYYRKILLALCLVSLTWLVSCGLNQPQKTPDYATEVIYRQEGYTPAYSYGIYHSTTEIINDFEMFGMPMGVATTDYYTILNPDGSFEKPIYEKYRDARERKYKELMSILSEEEIERLGDIGTDSYYLELEDATYVLVYDRIEEFGDYVCHLFRYDDANEVKYVKFEVNKELMFPWHEVATLAAYSDDTICVCDSIWFNMELEQVDKPSIKAGEYLLSKEMIISALQNCRISEVKAIAEEMVIESQGRIGNINYCFVGADKMYLLEIDTSGKLLSVVRIYGVGDVWGGYTIPKIQNRETKEYFDVEH